MNRAAFAILLTCCPSISFGQWSVFGELTNPAPPQVDHPAWSAPIDAFVLARLRQNGLSPAPPVDRRVWLRRVTFDLIGLPPTPDETHELLADPRPDLSAMADVVDRLLASPRYGEHWARHWLDVVRYADSDGFAIDAERPQLWRYRDYVIRILNEDRPFDQFVREQVAGDEIDQAGPGAMVAISYYRLGPWEADNMTPEHRRQDYLNDVTSNIGSAFLGLTIGFARCHDHKYDPISQADFYKLQAFIKPIEHDTLNADFLPGEFTAGLQQRHELAVREHEVKVKEYEDFVAPLRQQIADATDVPIDLVDEEALEQGVADRLGTITKEMAKRFEELKGEATNKAVAQRLQPKVTAVRNPKNDEKLVDTFILNNGDVFDPGERVEPGFPSSAPVFSSELVQRAAASHSSGAGRRRFLAEWLTSTENPLTIRALVNRIWQYHFGAGIVATPNDLGLNGSGPSHPELLDHLAQRLLMHGWRLKPLHRELVLSESYRMSSRHPEAQQATNLDPQNRLLWRAPLRRLDAETIRDAALAVSGRLFGEMGGPGFYESLPDEMERKYPFFNWNDSTEDQRSRRSVYMFQRRNLIHPMMEAFDGADMNQSCEVRRASVTAPQALALFNSRFAYDNSLHLARQIRDASADDGRRVEQLFWLALSRAPTESEAESCVTFLQQQRALSSGTAGSSSPESVADPELTALRDLALAVLNSNEFVYLD